MKKYLNKGSIFCYIAGIIAIWVSIFSILQILNENAMTLLLWFVLFIFIGFGIFLIVCGFIYGKNQQNNNIRLTKEEKEYRK